MLRCLERCSLVGTAAKPAWAKLLVRSAHPAHEELKLLAVSGALFSQGAQCFLWTSKLGVLQPGDLIAQPLEASWGLNPESAAL